MGCLLPFMAKLLADRGLSDEQVGYVLGAYGVAVMISPWLMTALADLGVPTRLLLAGCFLGTGVFAALIGVTTDLPALYAVHLFMCLSWVPVIPLQDSLYFSKQHTHPKTTPPYTRVRVWGTVGFVAASFALWAVLTIGGASFGLDLSVITVVGAVAAGLGMVNTFWLRDKQPAQAKTETETETVTPPTAGESIPRAETQKRIPTLVAARACLQPKMAMYLTGQWLLGVATFSYYAYLPLYLSRTVGFADQWLGLIVASGVVLEIGWVLILNRLIQRFGQRTVVVSGALLIALRLVLLALFPNPVMAVANQLLHGPMVLVMHVCPPMVLNRHAPPQARGSIQGVYATGILGTARLLGLAVAGHVAARFDYPGVMGAGVLLSIIAAALFAAALSNQSKEPAPNNPQ